MSQKVRPIAGDARWFEEARFGIFIHWGLYSILARGEWVRYTEKIPKQEYALLANKFKPEKFRFFREKCG